MITENKYTKKDTDNNIDKKKYSYYSNVLNKPFDTLNALEEAENKELEKRKEKELATSERKAAATKVEDAYKAYRAAAKTRAEDREARTEKYLKDQAALKKAYQEDIDELEEPVRTAEEAYQTALNEFTKKYGDFHTTFKDGDTTVSISEHRGTHVHDFWDGLVDWIFNW